ncbi:MAG: hypothetical protein LKM36_07580 [Flavobacteriales bacterium]|jgi:hypothetical protein|nr:hypothetical protein [Flavobacteriales bacterium]MCI1752710.1 hypothetical protein [Flavobacteriales bacterium]
MRKTLLILGSLVVHTCIWAQYTLSASNAEYVDQFLHSTLTVKLTGCPQFDAALQKAIENHWHQTPVIYATDQATWDAAESTLSFMEIRLVAEEYGVENGIVKDVYYGWGAQYHDRTYTKEKFNTKSLIACVGGYCEYPSSGSAEDCDATKDCSYRIGVTIAQLNEVVDYLKNNSYTGEGWLKLSKYSAAFNRTRDAKTCAKKPLLVNRKIFNQRVTEEDFREAYQHPLEIVDNDEYRVRIREGDPAYNYLLVDYSPCMIVSVFDPEQDQTLYLDIIRMFSRSEMMYSRQFNRTLLKDLIKAVGK